MQKKIYFNEKALVITDEFQGNENAAEGYFLIKQLQNDSVEKIIQEMEKKEVKGGIIFHPYLNEVLDAFKEKVTFIQAAGGLVLNNEHILLIFRRGKWDLPKGKLDEDENLPDAAVREVEEETGINNLKITKQITVTYHTYYQDNDFVLKETHWYLMETSEADNLQPQTEEDITECIWADANDLNTYLLNTHPSIADVLEEGLSEN